LHRDTAKVAGRRFGRFHELDQQRSYVGRVVRPGASKRNRGTAGCCSCWFVVGHAFSQGSVVLSLRVWFLIWQKPSAMAYAWKRSPPTPPWNC
ncbi:MAG TPA: hypothetical protein VEO01_33465, partial [Pseudonocardiaceae bacterium]|nr:hypothetical protein [Pseudonocardiaceae bacterium]